MELRVHDECLNDAVYSYGNKIVILTKLIEYLIFKNINRDVICRIIFSPDTMYEKTLRAKLLIEDNKIQELNAVHQNNINQILNKNIDANHRPSPTPMIIDTQLNNESSSAFRDRKVTPTDRSKCLHLL